MEVRPPVRPPSHMPSLRAHNITMEDYCEDRFIPGLPSRRFRLLAWGANTFGQLGLGTLQLDEPLPVIVSSMGSTVSPGSSAAADECTGQGEDPRGQGRPHCNSPAHPLRAVTGGANHSLAIDARGSLWACGANDTSQLGTDLTASSSAPAASARFVRVAFGPEDVPDPDIVAAAGGWAHSLALDARGTVWAWGDNSYGQTGIRETLCAEAELQLPSRPKIVRKPHPVALPAPAVRVACGMRHSAAVLTTGVLVTWGFNKQAQCGMGRAGGSGKAAASKDQIVIAPHVVRVPESEDSPVNGRFIDVACGAYHTVALAESGTHIVVFGQNKFAQLGLPVTGPRHIEPAPVWVRILELYDHVEAVNDARGPRRAVRIVAGWHHTALLLETGEVIMCGRNTHSQLGREHIESGDAGAKSQHALLSPSLPPGHTVIQLVCGSEHTTVATAARATFKPSGGPNEITRGPIVWSWGWNEHGNCGVHCEPLANWFAGDRGNIAVEALHLPDIPSPTPVDLYTGAKVLEGYMDAERWRVEMIGSGYAHCFAYLTSVSG